MGYTEFDIALLNAWDRAHAQAKREPEKIQEILRRRAMATYTRPLRSWSLVLRANDKRIEDDSKQGLVRMDGARIKQLCSPVSLPFPGVSLDEAASRFGVNRTTISRWASPADSKWTWWQVVQRQMGEVLDLDYPPSVWRVRGRRLMLEHAVNRANSKRSETRVWTLGFYGLDPSGEVGSAKWGSLRVGLVDQVDASFVQQLCRVDRKLGTRNPGDHAPCARVFQWVCPQADGGCGRRVYKLYLPMPTWSLARLFGCSDLLSGERGGWNRMAFLCLRCAGLLYESSERTSSPGLRKDGSRRRVSVMDRVVKRMSGCVLRGSDVRIGEDD